MDKAFRGKQFNNHKWLSHMYRFFDSIILKYIFSIKMMETISDQLESCRYDVSQGLGASGKKTKTTI
jgi:hypothetical protein